MEIRRDIKCVKLWLSQKKYISDVLRKFNVKCQASFYYVSSTPFASMVSCLMYAMVYTTLNLVRMLVDTYRIRGKSIEMPLNGLYGILQGTKSMGINCV